MDRVSPSAPSAASGTATPAVAVTGLSKSYGGIRALVEMDLEIGRAHV